MTTLNNSQQRSYTIAQQLARVLRNSKRIYSSITPFHNEVTDFLSNLEKIPQQAAVKATTGTGITAQKKSLKKEIAREATVICNLATAYAIATKNNEVEYNVRYSYSVIYTAKDANILCFVIGLTKTITTLLANDDFKVYGITAGHLTSLLEKARKYNSIMGRARWVNFRSQQASCNITATLQKIKANIIQFNRLLILFKESHPGFIESFQQALIITQKEKASTILEGTITDSNTGQPLENVTITAQGKEKTTLTNASGFYHLMRLKAGTHNITITAEGYTPVTIDVKIIRGKTITQHIHLEAIRFSLPHTEVA